jgi:tetratricopeptide (TPR) repeat protein
MAKKSRRQKLEGKRPPQTHAPNAFPPAPSAHKPWQIAAVCLLLAVATIFAYRGVRTNDFLTYDDDVYVVDNPQVQQGVTAQSIGWAFDAFHASNWHPLTWISHMVDWQLYGKNPVGHHLTNVCLHAANSILLFLLLLFMTGYLGRSALVAALFALHPAHVESVAWLAERKDLLCALFSFAALLAYLWYLRKPSWKRYAVILGSFACALMSKPMAVTLPFAMLLLDYWPLRRITLTPETRPQWFSSSLKLCLEKWPLFLLAVASSFLTVMAQGSGGSVGSLASLPLWERLSNASISYWRYVKLTFWPDPLRVFYYHETYNISVTLAVLSAVAIILVAILCWRIRKQWPYLLFGWLWFLGTLAPVIGIVQVGDQAMAERYTYIPFIGLFIAVVWLIADAVAKSTNLRIAAQILAVAILIVFAVKTDAQVKVWKNTITLFSHVLEIDPRGEIPNSSLGVAYERQGNFAQAGQYFEQSLKYAPDWALTLSYSALCIMQNEMQSHDPHNLPLAKQRLDRALSLSPDDPNILTNMALWDALMGRSQEEEAYSRRAVAAHPDDLTARLYLANSLTEQNKLDDAAKEWHQALVIDPNNYIAHYNIGVILERQELPEQAIRELRLSLALQPNQPSAHTIIGKLYTNMHQIPQAAEEFAQTVQLDPADPVAHNDLGTALMQLGENEKAVEQFNDALHIDPSNADAKRNLDLAQSRLKRK